ncbi:diacylglycerol/lipid kinase family protein [Saccharicrinis aurantiacus]|uniref:diacylglycerol/lipid kinase family protein n=1 Tax=Saccharicrinis aurantiacus TaxID=1849719 RepID=UPI0024900E00|nr:YegS/Rv2252/BmrU family lipid kinase [Saccharicrinis aurantiacus]
MVNRLLFLINPVSGIGKQRTIEKLIESELDKNKVQADVAYTQYKGHARELAAGAVDDYDVVVAVGGDGTVNEVASRLVGTDTALAIIPAGSGNGLARYLQIPLRAQKAVQALNYINLRKIDTLKVNQFCSVNVAGVGFDAHISHSFEGRKLRGPLSYAQLVSAEFAKYKTNFFKVTIDNEKSFKDVFLISFANSSQYGNNVYIAPNAKIDDGLVDVCVINRFPKIIAGAILLTLFGKTMEQNDFEEITKAKHIEIESDDEIKGHIDGEPVMLGKKAIVKVVPLSLNVVVPPKHLVDRWTDPFVEFIPNIEDFVNEYILNKKKEDQ